MPHCTKCGAAVAEGAGFCASCGSPVSAAPSVGSAPPAAAPAASGMAENVAGALCYVVGWITGIVFYLIDKRPFVRYHAAQSIVVFGGLHIIEIVLGFAFGASLFMGGLGGFSLTWAIYGLIGLVSFVLWIVLMIKAYGGERFRVPVAAGLAEKIFGKN